MGSAGTSGRSYQKKGEYMLGRQRPVKEICDKAGRGSEKSYGYDGGMKLENQESPNLFIALSMQNAECWC